MVLTEEDYAQLKALGLKCHIPIPEMHWRFEVFDKDGKCTHDHTERGHSWVRNGYNFFTSAELAINGSDANYGAGGINMKRTNDGVVVVANYPITWHYTINVEQVGIGYVGDSGIIMGIVIGTSGTAFNFEDYALGGLIQNGTGTGQMSYTASNSPTKAYVAGTKTYSAQYNRFFNNNSGGSIVVSEVGLYPNILVGSSYNVCMLARDVLASPVTVLNTAQLKVTYTISLQFPA